MDRSPGEMEAEITMSYEEGIMCRHISLAQSIAESLAQAGPALQRERDMQRRRERAMVVLKKVEAVRRELAAAQVYEAQEKVASLGAEVKLKALYLAAELGLRLFNVNLPEYELASNETFGTLRVLIDPGGIPEDTKVINVSKLARDKRTTEREVERSLLRPGSLLLSPNGFEQRVSMVVKQLTEGRQPLPVRTSRFPPVQLPPPRRREEERQS